MQLLYKEFFIRVEISVPGMGVLEKAGTFLIIYLLSSFYVWMYLVELMAQKRVR